MHAAPTFDRHSSDTGDRKTEGYRLLMSFMSKISAAATDVSENNVTAPCDALEEAIDLLEPIFGCFSDVLQPDDWRDVQFYLRRHAVLAPLRKNDRVTAKVTSLGFNRCVYIWSLTLQLYDTYRSWSARYSQGPL